MTIIHKYISFLREERALDEAVRSGNKELKSVDLSLFNFGPEYEFLAPYDKFSERSEKVQTKIKTDLEKLFGITIAGGDRYVSQETAKTTFRLTYDDSVKSDKFSDFTAVEFVGPIMSSDNFFNITKKLFDYIEREGYETSSTSGLHVGISFKDENKNKNLDPLKVIVFSGDQFLRQTWPRVRYKLDNGELSSDYVKSNIEMIQQIIKRVVFYSENPGKVNSTNIVELFTKWLDDNSRSYLQRDPEWKNKHFAVNIGRLKDGYVEFRVIGGKDYHKRFAEVEQSVRKFGLTLIQSDSPDTQHDYLKKLYKILNTVLDDLEDYDKMNSGIENRDTKIKIKNPKILQLLDRISPVFINNPSLKENIYNLVANFEKNKEQGINSILALFTQNFGKVEYKAALRSLLANMVRIYGVNKNDLLRVYNDNYFEPGKIPQKPDNEDEDSEFWAYEDGTKIEHNLTPGQIFKILEL